MTDNKLKRAKPYLTTKMMQIYTINAHVKLEVMCDEMEFFEFSEFKRAYEFLGDETVGKIKQVILEEHKLHKEKSYKCLFKIYYI